MTLRKLWIIQWRRTTDMEWNDFEWENDEGDSVTAVFHSERSAQGRVDDYYGVDGYQWRVIGFLEVPRDAA